MIDCRIQVAGVDGCKGGWVAVVLAPGELPRIGVWRGFADLLASLSDDAIVAVDMPIGLPDQVGKGGRGPEIVARRELGIRQSSVFSIPSRAAVEAERGPFDSDVERYAAHRRACDIARATSDPPRGVSIQAFGLFPKMLEIDALLRSRPDLRDRVFESHPEAAFCRLNGGVAMATPKKVRGKINPQGMDERRALLAALGLPPAFLAASPPRGAGADDALDAAVMALVAVRLAHKEARPMPDPPLVDGHGIPVAIWT